MIPHRIHVFKFFSNHATQARQNSQRFNGFFLSWWMPRDALYSLMTGFCLPISNIYIAFPKNFVMISVKSFHSKSIQALKYVWGIMYEFDTKRINLKAINNNYYSRAHAVPWYCKWDKWVNKSEICCNVSTALINKICASNLLFIKQYLSRYFNVERKNNKTFLITHSKRI